MDIQILFNFIEVGAINDVPPEEGRVFSIGDKDVAVFNIDGNIYAINNSCPHAGSSLVNGTLHGKILTCRSHGMKFDVTNGCYAGTSSAAVAKYPVKIVDGKILVSVPKKMQVDNGIESFEVGLYILENHV